MNRIVRSSVQKVGLLTRNVAAPKPITSVRASSYMTELPDVAFYGLVTAMCLGYAIYGVNRYRIKEERMLKYADKM